MHNAWNAELLLFMVGLLAGISGRIRLERLAESELAVEGTATQAIAVALMLPLVWAISFSGRFWISEQLLVGFQRSPTTWTARAGPILLFGIVAVRLLRRLYDLLNDQRLDLLNDQRLEIRDWRLEPANEAIMSEGDFRAAVKYHTEWSRKVVWSVFLAGLAGLPAALLIVLIPVRLLNRGRATEIVAVVGLLTGAIGLVLVVASVAVWRNKCQSKRDPRLVCPHCGGGLFVHQGWVILARKCVRCGSCVLGDSRKVKQIPALDPDF